MNRKTYATIATSTASDDYLIDAARKIFVLGVCAASPCHEQNQDHARGEANKVWELSYKDKAKKLLGLM